MSRSLPSALLVLLVPAPLAAQDAPAITAEEALANAEAVWHVTAPEPEIDPCADPEADEDTIVVCRRFEDGERYTFEPPPDRPVGAQVTDTAGGAPRAPDFNESCLHNRGRENCMMGGSVPPPAIMVDFATLPETPEGSEAARLYGGPTDATDEAVQREKRNDLVVPRQLP